MQHEVMQGYLRLVKIGPWSGENWTVSPTGPVVKMVTQAMDSGEMVRRGGGCVADAERTGV